MEWSREAFCVGSSPGHLRWPAPCAGSGPAAAAALVVADPAGADVAGRFCAAQLGGGSSSRVGDSPTDTVDVQRVARTDSSPCGSGADAAAVAQPGRDLGSGRPGPLLRRALPGLLALFLVFVFAAPLQAGEIDDTKRAGQVGERFDGYLGAVAGNPSPETKRLIADVNAGRRKRYEAIAAENGVPVEEIGKLSGAKLIERAASGDHVLRPGQDWRRK